MLIIDFYSQLIYIKIYTYLEIKLLIAIVIACAIEYAQKFGYFPPQNIFEIWKAEEIKPTFDLYDILAFVLGILMTYLITTKIKQCLPDE